MFSISGDTDGRLRASGCGQVAGCIRLAVAANGRRGLGGLAYLLNARGRVMLNGQAFLETLARTLAHPMDRASLQSLARCCALPLKPPIQILFQEGTTMKRLFNILSTAVLLITLYVVAHRYAYPGVAIDRQYAYFQVFLIIPDVISVLWLSWRFALAHKQAAMWILKYKPIVIILGAVLFVFILKITAFLIKEI